MSSTQRSVTACLLLPRLHASRPLVSHGEVHAQGEALDVLAAMEDYEVSFSDSPNLQQPSLSCDPLFPLGTHAAGLALMLIRVRHCSDIG